MSNSSKEEQPPGRFFPWRLLRTLCLRPRNLQDLISMLRRTSDEGVFKSDLLTMIEGVFSVGDMQVGDIMVPRSQMKNIRKDTPEEKILTIVTEGSHSRFPVIGDTPDKVHGVLHAKDLLRFFGKKEERGFDINDYLRPAVIVPESKRLKVLLDEFRKNRNHMAIVVDEYGGVSGLVTIEDVLEQIVGDITDEYDVEDNYVFPRNKGGFRIKAIMPLGDFNEHFDVKLSNSSSDTIGGFVANAFGYLPKRGESIEVRDFVFEVLRADNRRIHLLLMRKRTG